MKEFQLAIGMANCGKTAWAVDQTVRGSDGLNPVIVLLPSQSNIHNFKQRMIAHPDFHGGLNVHFHTYYSFVKTVADQADIQCEEIGRTQQRILLESFLTSRRSEYPELTDRTLTSGFYSAILQYFSDMEDGAFTIEQAGAVLSRLSMGQGSRLLIELHKLYITFTNHLESAGYLSRERLFVRVYEYLRKEPRKFKKYRFIVDGFYDFNLIQQKILETLLPKVQTAHVTLMDGSTDLFRYTNEASGWLHNLVNKLGGDVKTLEQENPLLPGIENIFSREGAGEENQTIEYIETSSPAVEIQEIVRSVKRDLITGEYRPDEIAVMYRGGDEYYNGIIDLCRKEGIAIAAENEQPLLTNPALSALPGWYDVLESNFSRNETVDWFLSGYINPANLHLGRLSRLTRKAQILEGRDEWVPRLEAALARASENSETETSGKFHSEITQFREIIPQIRDLLQRFPLAGKKSWKAHINDLRTVMRVARFLESDLTGDADIAARDGRALEAFENTLLSMERLTDDFNFPEVSSADFAAELRKILQDTKYVAEAGVSTGVTVASVPQTRGMHWKKVYIAGLIDEVFPVRWRSHALVKLKDRITINRMLEGEAAVAEHGADLHEERLLFYIALTRASERLLVSTVTGSEELLPSPFYEELRRFYNIHDESERVRTISQEFQQDNAWLEADLLRHLALASFGGDQLAGLDLMQFANLLKVREKRMGTSFTEYDGRLSSPDLIEEITSRLFDPDKAVSPSALEIYYESPFQYFCRYLLKLSEIEEVSDELPPAERGLILHSVMERFYHALPPEFGGKVTEANLESSRKYLSPVLKEVFHVQEEKGLPIPDLLWEREKRLMEQYVWNAIRFFATNSPWNRTGMQPDAFEFSFGMENEDHDALSIQLDDKTLKMRGRADRLDLNQAGEFTVVDYKTSGGKKVKDFYNGQALQLPLYAMAAKEKLKSYEQPLHLSYYSFKQGKEDGKVSLDEEKYEALHARTLELVDQALFQITSGIFHPTAGECNAYCPFKHMCRCEENRIRMKSG
ncbi:MAG: hypothetical protein GF372_05405 [Candidatus Marinimicrobia bacterium]|nr:hypothetical protein [Candidatus Neomarinimicrobiota bacterium]